MSGRSRSDRRWKVPIRRGFAATGLSLLVLLGGIAGGDFHAPAGVAGSSDIHGLPSAVSLHATPTLESGPYRGTGLKAQSTVRPDGSTPTRRAAPGGDPLSISNLTATPLRGQVPLTVTFSATVQIGTTARHLNVSWAWGDGTPLDNQNRSVGAGARPTVTAEHNFTQGGTFQVNLTADDGPDPNATATIAVQATVAVGSQKLQVTLAALPPAATVNRPILLEGDATGGIPPYQYVWPSLIPGCTALQPASQNASCTNVPVGTHTVVLEVLDSEADENFTSVSFVVNPKLTLAANGSASFQCTDGVGTVEENLSANPSGGTPPFTYSWNPGDGSPTVVGRNATHAYAAGSVFNVSLAVNDSSGATANRSFLVSTNFATCGSASGTGNPTPALLIGGIIALGVVVVVLIVLLGRAPPSHGRGPLPPANVPPPVPASPASVPDPGAPSG